MIKNLVEDHVIAAYDALKVHVPDYCGCAICRGDVLVYTLNRVPARYVATAEGSAVTELNLEKDQSRALIDVTMLEGFRKVARGPRCGRRPGST